MCTTSNNNISIVHNTPRRHALECISSNYLLNTSDEIWKVKHTSVPTSNNIRTGIWMIPKLQEVCEQLLFIFTLLVLNIIHDRLRCVIVIQTPHIVDTINVVLTSYSDDWLSSFFNKWKAIIGCNFNIDCSYIDLRSVEWNIIWIFFRDILSDVVVCSIYIETLHIFISTVQVSSSFHAVHEFRF